MKPEYASWIQENVQNPLYACKEVTEKMAKAFPELTRVRGHYYCLVSGERPHWWLKTSDDEIVDPTAAQFISKGSGEYIELDESEEQPIGKCLNCGEYCYWSRGGSGDTCSDACYNQFANSLGYSF